MIIIIKIINHIETLKQKILVHYSMNYLQLSPAHLIQLAKITNVCCTTYSQKILN